MKTVTRYTTIKGKRTALNATSPKQVCEECGKPISPIFKGGRSADTWFWLECSGCERVMCEACVDVVDDLATGISCASRQCAVG